MYKTAEEVIAAFVAAKGSGFTPELSKYVRAYMHSHHYFPSAAKREVFQQARKEGLL